MIARRASLLPMLGAAVLVLTADLSTKHAAVNDPGLFGHGVIYNPDIPSTLTRIVVCVLTVLVIWLMTRLAASRGIGAIPLVWLAGGLLVGGVLANWVSGEIWEPGVPDFISGGDRLWNLADFSIGTGMAMFVISSVAYALRGYVRGRRRSLP